MAFKRFLGAVLETGVIAVIAVAAVFLCRQYVFNPYAIAGTSMAPSFRDGDYVFVDQLTYRAFREPQRGEVIVFHGPLSKGEDLVKRIVGLPGERVVIARGEVTIFNEEHPDGILLQEAYLPPSEYTGGEVDVRLGEKEYFVLGDNRAVSFDSRSWGVLAADRIVGRVLVRAWPPQTAQVYAAPQY